MEFTFESDPNNPYEEVKKLKYLVKQLELQNKQLQKSNTSPNRPSRTQSLHDSSGHSKKFVQSDSCKCLNKGTPQNESSAFERCVKNNYLKNENIHKSSDDILNLEELEMSDEDSWLYASPIQLPHEEAQISPLEWLRRDLEDVNNKQLQLAKGALSSKLDELAILTPHCKRDDDQEQKKRQDQEDSNANEEKENMESESSPPSLSNHLNTRTFTRDRRKKSLPTELPPVIDRKLADSDEVLTIQELARQQEESLRLTSTNLTPKRSIVPMRPTNLVYWSSSNSDIDGQDILALHASPTHLLNSTVSKRGRSSLPARPANGPMSGTLTDIPSSNSSFTLSSSHSSPGPPPQAPPSHLGTFLRRGNKQGDLHRSMPNLNRIAAKNSKLSSKTFKVANRPPLSAHPITSSTTQSTGRTSLTNSKTVVTKLPPRPTAAMGPRRDSGPSLVSSGLPRPSKSPYTPISKPRSGIPAPSPRPSHRNDSNSDLWSDGCY